MYLVFPFGDSLNYSKAILKDILRLDSSVQHCQCSVFFTCGSKRHGETPLGLMSGDEK